MSNHFRHHVPLSPPKASSRRLKLGVVVVSTAMATATLMSLPVLPASATSANQANSKSAKPTRIAPIKAPKIISAGKTSKNSHGMKDGTSQSAKRLVLSVVPSLSPVKKPKTGASGSAGANGPNTFRAADTGDPTAPFNECPAVGADTSCQILVNVTDSDQHVIADPGQGTYDGSDDSLIGVLNSSGSTLNSIALSSDTAIFGFDGDGLCTFGVSGCPFGSTGYEGPNTSFSGIDPSQTGGTVNFTGGLAPGQSAYFSLEEALSADTVTSGGPTAPEQGSAPSPVELPTTCSSGDPVNCATGEFWQTFTDLKVPGRGLPLDFGHTYSSGAAGTDGPLGHGWTDSYAMSMATDTGTGDVTITESNGSTVPFSPNGFGGFIAPPRVLASLVANGDGTFTYTHDSDQSRYIFSATGQLTGEADRNGYLTTLAYSGGLLSTVTDPAGRTLTFTYSGSRIATVTDPASRSVSFTYNSSGDLTSATDANGGVTSFTYDTNHLLLTMTDPRSGVTTNVYDGSNRVTSQTDPASRTRTWAYSGDAASAAGGVTTITDAKGNVTTHNYANLELMSLTVGSGTSSASTTSYTYDPATLGRTTITDPNGHVTTNTFDSAGNQLSSTDALSHTTSATYDSLNDQLTSTDPNSVTTTMTYDSAGNLLTKSTPIGSSSATTTTNTYGDSTHPGDVTGVTDPNSHTTTLTYDTNGDVASSTDAVGDKTTFAYNTIGWMTSKVDPKGNVPGGTPTAFTTTYDHDQMGRVTTTKDPLWISSAPTAHKTVNAYDADGNLTSVTDGNGHTTTYAYDAANEKTTTTNPDSTTQSSTYWPDGSLETQTDGNGHTTTYAYDPAARLTSITDPLSRATTYSYDTAGNLINKVDPGGTCSGTPSGCTTYTHDAANRLTNVGYSDSTPSVAYVYDANGHRTSMTDGTGTTTTAWDSLGRLTSQTNGASVTTSYGYDTTGNLTTIGYPGSNTVTRTYDAANRFTAVSDWLGHTNRFTYDPNSNETSSLAANGVADAATFDNGNQLNALSIAKGSAANISYTRNGGGQLTSSVSTGALTQPSETYGYDTNNRLSSVNSSNLTYDNANNITTLQDGSTQAYDNASQLTTKTLSGTTTTYGYDPRGNRTSSTTSGQTTTLRYDEANRMKTFATPTTSTTYSYDGDGNRMSKTVAGTSSAFVYDQAASLSQILSDGTNNYIYGPGGAPVEQINGTTATYLHQDQLGSTRVLTDSSRNVVGTYSYDAYGKTTSHTGTATTPMQYAGQYLDAESGLYWMRARYYDPTTAQFVNVDPMASLTKALYAYATDDPTDLTDPSGLICTSKKCLFHDVAIGAGAVSTVTAFIPIPGAGVISEAAGVIALLADLGSCVATDDCDWVAVGLDVLALVPGLAAVRFEKRADQITDLLKGLHYTEDAISELQNDRTFQLLYKHIAAYAGGDFSAGGVAWNLKHQVC